MADRLFRLAIVFSLSLFLCAAAAGSMADSAAPTPSGKVRTYYVAADEVEWNYTPDGINKMMGMKFEERSRAASKARPYVVLRPAS